MTRQHAIGDPVAEVSGFSKFSFGAVTESLKMEYLASFLSTYNHMFFFLKSVKDRVQLRAYFFIFLCSKLARLFVYDFLLFL